MKRAIYPLYAPQDEGKVQPILEALKERGVSVRTSPGKGDALVLFLSREVTADGPVADAFVRLNAGRDLVIPVNLDGCPVPAGLESALMARHGLDGRKYDTAALADLIAKALESKSRLPLILTAVAAAALLVVGGLIYLKQRPEPKPPVVEATATPEPTATAAPTPSPTPSPTPEPTVDGIDLRLSEVAEVVYVGSTMQYYQMSDRYRDSNWEGSSYHEFAYDNWEDGRMVFYSTEDGHPIEMGDLGDVSYLTLLPNLRYLTFVNVRGELPDLSSLQKLQGVTILGSDIPDLRGLAGSSVTWIEYQGDAVKDFSPLNDCLNLSDLTLVQWNDRETDLSNLSPKKVRRLNVTGKVTDLSGFSGCERLREVHLRDTYISDLSFLQGSTLLELHLNNMPRLTTLEGLRGVKSLQKLQLDNCDQLTTLDGLQGMNRLKWLNISNSDRLRDISALEGCENLVSLDIGGYNFREDLRDVSVLATLTKLSEIRLYGININNLDFLKTLETKKILKLGVTAPIRDFSGLEAIESFSILDISPWNGNFSPWAEHLKDKPIRALRIDDARNLDLSTLPQVTQSLTLLNCDIRDLSTLKMEYFTDLQLVNCPYLSSLAGIENLSNIGKRGSTLVVENCPRLTDWSAIEGKEFYRLEIMRMLTMPDLAKITFAELALEQLPEDVLPDLHCLDGLDEGGRYSFRFVGMDQITDLSPLFRLYGQRLEVPPQVGEQAQGLVEDKHFKECEIVYPEGGWDPNQIEVRLLSLDELDTLPPSILKHVKHLTIIGDHLVNDDTMNFWSEWGEQNVPAYLEDRTTGEQTKVDKPGTLFTDFSRFNALTGLEDLNLWWQPLTDLEGIQTLESLRWLKVEFCPKLTDVSAAFTLQGLREINVERCPVASLQGVQNLYDLERLGICNTKITSLEGIEGLTHLCEVRLAGTNVRDFSPLAAVDFSYAMEQEWQPGVSLALNVMNSNSLKQDALAFLENVPGFSCLELHDVPARLWVDKLANKSVRELRADNCGITDEQFRALIEAHPELEEVSFAWNRRLTDVSALLGLENLRYVSLSHDMTKAVASLGEGFRFQLQVN